MLLRTPLPSTPRHAGSAQRRRCARPPAALLGGGAADLAAAAAGSSSGPGGGELAGALATLQAAGPHLPPQLVVDLAEGLETPVQLVYLLTLLGFLTMGAYLVVRQVLIRRELEEAAKVLGDRIRAGEASSEDYFELGVILLRKKLFTQATKNLERAKKEWGGAPEELAQARAGGGGRGRGAGVHNALGFAYFNMERLQPAVEEYLAAVALQPGYVTAWNNLGDAYERLKQYQEALGAYTEALTYAPNNKDASGAAAAAGPLFPQAVAYFPLTDADLTSSFPYGQYTAVAHNVAWTDDDDWFGRVLRCDQASWVLGAGRRCRMAVPHADSQSHLTIPGLRYGENGSWAVAFWVRMNLANGSSMDYMLSHNNSAQAARPGWDPDEASPLPRPLPAVARAARCRPRFGVVRAIAMGSDDPAPSGSTPTYLDSDGCVSQETVAGGRAGTQWCTPANYTLFRDEGDAANWHLIALTTHPEGGKGFHMYVDGQPVAQMDNTTTYYDDMGFVHAPTAGGPMNLTGDLTLCARADLEPSHFYNGSIAHLFIFNASLGPDQVAAIYNTGVQAGRAAGAGAGAGAANKAVAADKVANASEVLHVEPAAEPDVAVALRPGPAAAGAGAAPACATPCEDPSGSGTGWCTTADGMLTTCDPGAAPGPGSGNAAQVQGAAAGPDAHVPVDCISACQESERPRICSTIPAVLAYGTPCSTPCALLSGGSTADAIGICKVRNNAAQYCRNVTLGTSFGTLGAAGGLGDAAPPSPSPPPAGGPYSAVTTRDGAPCQGPCQPLQGATVGSPMSVCRVSSSTFAACQNVTAADPPAPSPAAAFSAAGPGASASSAATLGGLPLCSMQSVAGLSTVTSCSTDYVCAPLSQQQVEANLGSSVANQSLGAGLGVCAYAPNGLLLPDPSVVPAPMVFFPLGGQTLQSFPLPEYRGTTSGATIAPDALFGAALSCQQNDSDAVALDPVQYAAAGPFTLNIWVKPGNLSGEALSYVFSHTGTNNVSSPMGSLAYSLANTGFQPNQARQAQCLWRCVWAGPPAAGPAFPCGRGSRPARLEPAMRGVEVYMPQRDHAAYGVVRAYARDAEDVSTGPGSQAFIDSDGAVAYTGGPRAPGPIVAGGWHMLSLATRIGGGKGYRLFLDGQLVNEIGAPGQSYYTEDGYPVQVTGGGPAQLTGNVILCSRSDASAERHFDGQLAYLSLFDTGESSLNDSQVAALYTAVQRNMAKAARAPPPTQAEVPVVNPKSVQTNVSRTSVSGLLCIFPALYNGVMSWDCVNIAGTNYCSTGPDQWEACAPAPGNASSPASYSAVSSGLAARYTVDGQECVFPTTYQGQNVTDCIPIGGVDMCKTATGLWRECEAAAPYPASSDASGLDYSGLGTSGLDASPSPAGALDAAAPAASDQSSSRAPIYTVDGQTCELPLTYNGGKVDGCVSIAGGFFCWAEESQGWALCPPEAVANQPTDVGTGLEAGAVSLLALPVHNYSTVDGEHCQLPTSEILDDCVFRAPDDASTPAWSCLTAAGAWKRCDLGNRAPTDEQGQLQVAQRTALSGEACLLPAVFNGYLWFDCVDYTEGGATVDICPTANATWDACLPVTSIANATTVPFASDAALNRTAPGRDGMLCPLAPDPARPNADCQAANLTCVPLPDLGANASAAMAGLGFCTPPPAGGTFGIFQHLQEEAVPAPLAFFPLTASSLGSLLLPPYAGSASGSPLPTWVNDTAFSSVVDCHRAAKNALLLDNLPYALNGSFAISLWMRRLPGADTSGATFQYLFSHAGVGAASTYSPNQANGSVQPGASRAINLCMQDANDDATALTFVDSDGAVSSNAFRNTTGLLDVNDGDWHMITLSTFPNNTAGYALYVDGREAGAITNASTGTFGAPVEATGGQPAEIDEPIHLCARSDLDPDRFYDGAVAHLTIWNDALTPDQVAGIYRQYGIVSADSANRTRPLVGMPLEQKSGTEEDPVQVTYSDAPGGSGGGGSSTSAGAIVGIVFGVLGGVIALGALAALFVTHHRRRRSARMFERYRDDPFAAAEAGPDAPGSSVLAPMAVQLSAGRSLGKELGHDGSPSRLSDVSALPTPTAAARGPGGLPRDSATSHLPRRAAPTAPANPFAAPPSVAGSSSGGSGFTEGVRIEGGGRKPARVVLPPGLDEP
eukprot:scaffold1.g5410.t1